MTRHADTTSARTEFLQLMGHYLQLYRKHVLRETQEQTAKRLEVSRSTYIRMEKGDPSVRLHEWVAAWGLMDVLHDMARAAEPGDVLFSRLVEDSLPGHGGTARTGSSIFDESQTGSHDEPDTHTGTSDRLPEVPRDPKP